MDYRYRLRIFLMEIAILRSKIINKGLNLYRIDGLKTTKYSLNYYCKAITTDSDV